MDCLNDEKLDAKYSAEINTNITPRELYYYGLPGPRELNCLKHKILANTAPWELYYAGLFGDEHEQVLYSTKFTNTIAMILNRFMMIMIERAIMYMLNQREKQWVFVR